MVSPFKCIFVLMLCLLMMLSYALGDSGISSSNQSAVLAIHNPPSQAALDGFFAAAFTSEYGDTDRNTLIRWEEPLSIYVRGAYTTQDMTTLTEFLNELSNSVPGLPAIAFASSENEANVVISFVPLVEMALNLTTYEPGNWGLMNCFSEDTGIRYGLIAIATDVTEQEDRNHLIMEEFVNMLGLTNDLGFAPDSIIYQPYTRTQALSAMDYEMLNLLYSPYLLSGMKEDEARQALFENYQNH